MAGFQVKKMNWGRTMSAYESMQAWRAKRKAFQEKYEANMQEAVSALQTTWNDVGYNVGEIAAKKALARIEAETKAKQEEQDASAGYQNIQIYEPKYSLFSSADSAMLDSGASVDIAGNTLTLDNGTVIDLTTGLEKVDVTV